MTAALPLDESLQHSLTTRQTSNFWFEHGLVTTTDVALLYLNELHVCNSLVSTLSDLFALCWPRSVRFRPTPRFIRHCTSPGGPHHRTQTSALVVR